ncbi:hypothetical protein BCR33DRAFT_212100 [Rhizoclosmatium globosum]|uniref:Uncharacterized protein n=1 Tax=Rhizoclosmatium globosum TaxID=329046 RepID=A0A1Y2CCX8_9FUNG|nr:hypothetical protein BCR33DRAFT_212100 [Rhizoclosmatium globosum]|eukprot:ORY44911.1 hypothetical protein BCR33DRAFT_212100 [Rhizoclosmatium globosum]
MNELDARTLIDSGYVADLCAASDVIINADTVPDSRAVLLSLLEKDVSKRCKSNIIIEMTNRYDWNVADLEEYNAMLLKLIENPPPNLFWTANNPFEELYMRARIGKSPKVRLVRSLGAWNVDSSGPVVLNPGIAATATKNNDTNDSSNRFAMVQTFARPSRPIVRDLVEFYCMPIDLLPKRYKGPAGLSKYKAFLDFPYQVSVMKFYENIAHGIPQVIPTPRFLYELVKVITYCTLSFKEVYSTFHTD